MLLRVSACFPTSTSKCEPEHHSALLHTESLCGLSDDRMPSRDIAHGCMTPVGLRSIAYIHAPYYRSFPAVLRSRRRT